MKMRCVKARKSVSRELDGRLAPAARAALQEHLRSCASCREWREEQSWLRHLLATPRPCAPRPGFHDAVMARIASAPRRSRFSAFPSPFLRPALLRAAAILAFTVSALFGYILGARLESAEPLSAAAAVGQTLNLNTFADMPGDSFGAVYERLLQGELR
ncbi:MAG: zf-HC2 domain-containing protein [Candidatus Aminicenantes bacterium]|nr:zf-HC2 domain-containing protein [Candidatus Aminicenantes bacterium]